MFPVFEISATVSDAGRLRGWIEEATLRKLEFGVERVMRWLFVLSLAVALAVELLQTVPAPVAAMHPLGEFVRNLAYGYAAAFFFHLLVVSIPARARARRAYRAMGRDLAGLVRALLYARLDRGSRERLKALRGDDLVRWQKIHDQYARTCEELARRLLPLAVDLDHGSARLIAQLAEPGARQELSSQVGLFEQSDSMREMAEGLLREWVRTAPDDCNRPKPTEIFRAPEMNALISELSLS